MQGLVEQCAFQQAMCVVRSNISASTLERANLSWVPWSLDLNVTIHTEMTFQAQSLVSSIGNPLVIGSHLQWIGQTLSRVALVGSW